MESFLIVCSVSKTLNTLTEAVKASNSALKIYVCAFLYNCNIFLISFLRVS